MKPRSIISIIFLLVFVTVSGCDLAIEDHLTEVATPRATHTDAFTATPTILPSMTLVPALSKSEADARILEVLSDNGGCKLPCFWGFTPGETSMQEYLSFIHAYSQIAASSGPGVIITLDANTVMMVAPVITLYSELQNSGIVKRILVEMTMYQISEYGEYVFSNSFFTEFTQYYSLPSLLNEYGPPSKALVQIEHDMGLHDFYLYLEYSEQEWSVRYRMPLEGNGTNFIGCLNQSLISLWLWAPKNTDENKDNDLASYLTPFLPLEEVTSMTLEEFYQQFKDPENTKCLESPMELWMP